MQTQKTQAMQDAYAAYGAKDVGKTKEPGKTEATNAKKQLYGKTVGEPELSEKAQKYYDSLKKKYGQYDFILVSSDQKANAQANAAKYANPYKPVVLIDEEKIEKMATDEKFRKQYEGIISGASAQLSQMKAEMEKSGANVKGYGMQVNEDGTTSLFAVLKNSSADQKARIEKKAAEHKLAKKEADKKAAKKAAEKKKEEKIKEEKLQDKRSAKSQKAEETDDEDTVTITANSMEELLRKVSDFTQNDRMNSVQTEAEKMVGGNIDFSC